MWGVIKYSPWCRPPLFAKIPDSYERTLSFLPPPLDRRLAVLIPGILGRARRRREFLVIALAGLSECMVGLMLESRLDGMMFVRR